MSTPTLDLLINIKDPLKRGLLAKFDGTGRADLPLFARGDGEQIRLCCVQPVSPPPLLDGAPIWEYVDISTGCVVRVGIGATDRSPTGGTFTLTWGGNTTAAMAYNVSAATMDTQVSSITAEAVTVTQAGTDYRIEFDTAGLKSNSFTSDPALLSPTSVVTCSRVVTGAAGRKEVWIIRVAQQPYAYATPSTALATLSATITATTVQAGTSSRPGIQKVTFNPKPYGGVGIWAFARPDITFLDCQADVADSLHNSYCRVYAGIIPIRCVVETTGVAPGATAPPGGRLVTANAATGNTATQIATAIAAAFDGDADLVATSSGSRVTITTLANGVSSAPLLETLTTFAILRYQEGCSISTTLPFDVSEEDLEAALNNFFTVVKIDDATWQLTAVINNTQNAITVETVGLLTPTGVTGALQLATDAMAAAFGAVTTDPLPLTFSVELEFSGQSPYTPLLLPCKVARDIIEAGSLVASPSFNVTVLTGTATWNPGSVADGSFITTNVTVPGAVAGDPAHVGFTTLIGTDCEGTFLTATVRAADTACVNFFNFSGAPIDPISGTVRVDVFKH